jgi:uncharacterized membrane protein
VATASPESLESRIGGRWTLYIGAIAVILGVVFFVRYAAENQWITPAARVLIAAASGLVLIGSGLRFARRGYPLYGQILCGAGFVAFYVAVYAAVNFYGLIGVPAAFVLFVLVTIAAAGFADRERSAGIALMAVIGGFVTPFFFSSDRDAQIFLFSYDALLVAGTIVLATRRAWPALNLVSLFLTTLTIFGWAGRFYTPEKYLRTELFLTLFCAMFLYARTTLALDGPSRESVSHDAQALDIKRHGARFVGVILALTPAAYHLASLAVLFEHSLALLIYLIAFTLAGLVAAVYRDSPGLRLVVWLAVALPFLGWLTDHATSSWLVGGLAVAVSLYGMHLSAQVERVLRGGGPDSAGGAGGAAGAGGARRSELAGPDILVIHLNGLGLFAAIYLLLEATHPALTAAITVLLAVWHGALASAIRTRAPEASINALAVAFTLLAVALGIQFSGLWLTVGWAAEGAAVIWVGLRSGRQWIRAGGAALLAFAIARLLADRFFDTPAVFTAIFNTRAAATMFIVGLLYAVAWVHRRVDVPAEAGTYQTSGPGTHVPAEAGTHRVSDTAIAISIVAANVLTLLLISVEIHSFWDVRESEPTAYLMRGVMLSLAWTLYGVAAIAIGIQRRYAPLRYFAIVLLGIAIAKVFLVDFSELGGLYRVLGFVAFGGALLVASYLYQKYRARIL